MFVIKFHSTSLPANIQIHICVQRCPSSVLCYSLSSCPDTCNCVLLAIAKVALPISPLAVVDFLSSFQIAQQPFLSIISSAMPDWYNDHDFRHCGSDNESEICNGSPSLQSALWQSESCSVKERERIRHRLHCAKAGLSVWCLWPSPSLPPPFQCSAVQCTVHQCLPVLCQWTPGRHRLFRPHRVLTVVRHPWSPWRQCRHQSQCAFLIAMPGVLSSVAACQWQ